MARDIWKEIFDKEKELNALREINVVALFNTQEEVNEDYAMHILTKKIDLVCQIKVLQAELHTLTHPHRKESQI